MGARFADPPRPALDPPSLLHCRYGVITGRDEFRPRQTRQLPRAVDLKGADSKLSKLLIKYVICISFSFVYKHKIKLKRVKIISAMKHQHGQITISFSRVSHPRKPEQ